MEGDYSFCTQSEPFTIVGDADCEARGYKKERFREENIGEARDYQLTVSQKSLRDRVVDRVCEVLTGNGFYEAVTMTFTDEKLNGHSGNLKLGEDPGHHNFKNTEIP